MRNRLGAEKSPYLHAHAEDPIGWFPWGTEALELARKENKPIFLSLGFSACHWCHVIHRESFLDPEIAGLLNRSFVPVKVDRQERPDLDAVFMAFCMAMTGGGGWPLNAILNPEGLPVFVGTYFPPRSTARMPGLLEILAEVSRRWPGEKEELARTAARFAGKLSPGGLAETHHLSAREAIESAFKAFCRTSDPLHGGFGTAPKFPLHGNTLFLLAYSRLNPGSAALSMAVRQLEAMRLGGIFDHLGYGFSRYSVDRQWHIPHFEKMLGDNALSVLLYHEAGVATSRPALGRVSKEVLEYLSRDMRRDGGGYCASEDADSGGEEGLFYTWTQGEINRVLGAEKAERFCRVFNVSESGNFENGRSVPWREPAENGEGEILELDSAFEISRCLLLEERSRRDRPARDDSALAEWNGLVLGALARLGAEDPESLAEAKGQWKFCRDSFFRKDGRLLRVVYDDGAAVHEACLDDHAALLWGLSELYGATREAEFLEAGRKLSTQMEMLFGRAGQEGFDFLPSDGEPLPLRIRYAEDGGLPSGNGMAAYGMARFYRFTGDTAWKEKAQAVYRGFSTEIGRSPWAFATLLAGMAEIELLDAGRTA
jgi:uncharacterized protein YyaL (SSP411 family)